MGSLDYSGDLENIVNLHQQLFMPKENIDLITSFFNSYFNFLPNNDIQLLAFYNYINLPYFISEQTFSGFFSRKDSISKDELITTLYNFYFGDIELRIQLIFNILDFNNKGMIHKENAIALFKTFNSVKISIDHYKIEEDGITVLDYFFLNKNEISFDEYIKILKEENSDLFYLFYMFYKKYIFFNYQSVLHYMKVFYNKNNQDIKGNDDKNNINVHIQLFPPSDVLLEYFNTKFGTNFETNDELKELLNFESEMKGIKITGTKTKKEDNNTKKSRTDIINFAYVFSSGDFTKQLTAKTEKTKASSNQHGSSLKLQDDQSCTDKLQYYSEHSEKVLTFPVEWLNKDKYSQYYIDILCENIYIYNSQKLLKIMFPFQHLYLEEEPKIEPQLPETKPKYPVSFYSELNNNLKQCVLYFSNNEDIIKLKQHIQQKIKYFPFDQIRFSNQQMIDKGSFGQIMKAYDNILEKEVAVKIINKPRANKENIKMIRNEQDICSFLSEMKLNGMIYIFDIFETKNNVFIIEELIKDGNLKDYLEKNKLSTQQKINLLKQIAESIDILHTNGIVHRDLKLENILIQKSENGSIQTKIIDFGLSSFFSKQKNMKDKYGTLLYLPPEIVLNNSYTEKIDVWDFGIIAYTIVSNGVHPFCMETDIQLLLKKIINRKFDYQNIDPIFEPLLIKCLQKEKERADIKEVLQIINSIK